MITRIIEFLEQNNGFESGDKEIVEYGLRLGLLELVNTITILLIGLAFGMVVESLIFLLVYIPLRTFVGGYHSRTALLCYLTSILLVSSVLVIVKYFMNFELQYYILTVSCLVIIFLSPVEDENKPLDLVERKRYKKISVVLLGAVLMVLAFISFISMYYGYMIIISLSVVSLLALMGYFRNLLGS